MIVHLLAPLQCLRRHRHVIRRFAIKDIQEKYRNTFLGLFWFLLTPALYLAAFSVVFGYILPGREAAWQDVGGGNLGFVVAIFSGLIVFWLFAAVVAESANLIQRNSHLVSEIVFPTELLPWVSTLTALFGLGIHLLLFGLLYALEFGAIQWTVLALPLVLAPFVMMLTGLAWIVAAVGALVRDVGQLVQVGLTAVLLVSGIFFPAEQVPEAFRGAYLLNPVARTIHDFRGLTFSGELPSFGGLLIYFVAAYGTMVVGYWFFKRIQPRFSELL